MSTSAERMRVLRANKRKRKAERQRENARRGSRKAKAARASAERDRRRRAKLEKFRKAVARKTAIPVKRSAREITHRLHTSEPNRSGRPRKTDVPRCACGAMTAARAKHQ